MCVTGVDGVPVMNELAIRITTIVKAFLTRINLICITGKDNHRKRLAKDKRPQTPHLRSLAAAPTTPEHATIKFLL